MLQGNTSNANTSGDIIGVALDMETNNGSLTFYKNGVSQGVAATGLGAYLTNGEITGVGSWFW